MSEHTEVIYSRTKRDRETEVTQGPKENKTNHLESFLNDIYEKECVFEASKEEVEFIQTGIETLVQKIVDLTIASALSDLEIHYDHYRKENVKFKKVYFSSNYSQVETTRSKIIKVGSFYEGTKNKFPDEFDFIFPTFHVMGNDHFEHLNFHSFFINLFVKKVTKSNKQSLIFIPDGQSTVTRELYFDQYLQEHGPAFMLRFIYINSRGDRRNIHVDLVHADEETPDNMELCLKEYETSYYKIPLDKCPKSFKKEILSKETCLTVCDTIYSFTETEVHFMRNILSEKHRKVYRILKFLINGHGDGEILGLLSHSSPISSYTIKMRMIEHHDECRNLDTINIGECVKQFLEHFKLINSGTTHYLNKLKHGLEDLQAAEDTYNYDQVGMKSLSRQYMDGINRKDIRYDLWFRYIDTLGGDDPCMDSFEQFLNAKKPGWRRFRRLFKSVLEVKQMDNDSD